MSVFDEGSGGFDAAGFAAFRADPVRRAFVGRVLELDDAGFGRVLRAFVEVPGPAESGPDGAEGDRTMEGA